MIRNTPKLLEQRELRIITNRGHLIVENKVMRDNAVYIMAPKPQYLFEVPNTGTITIALEMEEEDLDPKYSIEIVNGGLNTLLVPIKNLESILKLTPQLETLKTFCIQNGIDIIEVFCKETVSQSNFYRTRVFAPTFGYLEDPTTGSGNSAFGYYLLKHGLWYGELIQLEQNGQHDNYNVIKLKAQKDCDGHSRVFFGGGAIVRVEGIYYLT